MASRSGRRQLEDAMKMILQGLNVAQKAAVTSPAPVLQVLAPPGSGKTKTLTSRVAYLLTHEEYAPWNVICCTFTIKASREMRERLRGMIGQEVESKLILGTFHSVCRRYLVKYGYLIGIPKNFGIADSDDSLNIIKRAVKRLKLSIDPKVARSKISHRKARGEGLEDLPKPSAKNIDAQEFRTIFQEYEDTLALSNLLDYDDLLMRCVDLLREHPGCVSNIEALLIDEFQDTNIVQFELMKLLASAKRRVTIVGDPDQSIYGFRSAEIENLRRMQAFYPETVVINLEENYRSASAVLKLAQTVIEQDNDRPSKSLKSTHRYGTLPVLRILPNPHEEAQWIVSEIRRMTAMTGNLIHHGDIAILLRSAYLSLLIEKALANYGIPYRMVGGRRFFDRAEIRILLDYLRTISHPDNSSALLAIINTPTRKIGDTTVKVLTAMAEQQKESLWSICLKVLDGQLSLDKKLSNPAEQGLRDLVRLIKNARQKLDSLKPQDAPGQLIELVVNHLNYRNYLKKQYQDDHEERWENVRELVTQATDASLHFNVPDEELPIIDGVKQQEVDGAQEVLARFLANIVLSSEVEKTDEDVQTQRVTISTIHSAKGLEWPIVFIPAVYEGSLPHSRAEDTNEERRLLYVAMTRAQALLYMTFPMMQSREYGESVLSQFLPSEIVSLVSQKGPDFNDKIIEDIASILRRQCPTQEAIAKGHLSIKSTESQRDDLWPEDGSHRKWLVSSNDDPVSFTLQKGQSLSDALKRHPSSEQRSHYSTLSNPHASSVTVPTTMDNLSAFSTSNMSTGFTSANQHMKMMPSSQTPTPSLIKSTSDGAEPMHKKPKFIKSSSAQGNIMTFFASTGPTKDENRRTPALHDTTAAGPELTLPSTKILSEATIPSALSNHRLSYGTSFMNKRPRVDLDEVKAKSSNQTEQGSNTSLSAPVKDEYNASRNIGMSDQADIGHCPAQIKQETHISTSTPSIIQSSITSMHMTSAIGTTTTSSMNDNSFQSGQIRRLGGLGPLNNMQSSINGQQTGHMRRTLGVRRSMNGWDNRKNK